MWEMQPKLNPHPPPWCEVSMHSALKWFSRVVKPISTNYPNKAHYSRLTPTDVAYYFWTALRGLFVVQRQPWDMFCLVRVRIACLWSLNTELIVEQSTALFYRDSHSFWVFMQPVSHRTEQVSNECLKHWPKSRQAYFCVLLFFSTSERSQHNVRQRFGQNAANQIISVFSFFPPCFLSDTVLPRTTKFQSHPSLRKRPLVALCLCFSFQNVWVPCFTNLQWFITIPNSAEQQKGKESRRTRWWECAPFPFSLCHVDDRTTCLPGSHISITLWKFATRCILITLRAKKKKRKGCWKEWYPCE